MRISKTASKKIQPISSYQNLIKITASFQIFEFQDIQLLTKSRDRFFFLFSLNDSKKLDSDSSSIGISAFDRIPTRLIKFLRKVFLYIIGTHQFLGTGEF